jgi:hypothetical protein
MRGRFVALVVAGALAVSAGCSDSNATYEPETGFWSYFDGGLVDNNCGRDDVYRDSDTTFWLTNHLDGSFTIEQGTAGDFTCTIDGASFVCPQRLSDAVPVTGYDATINYHVRVSGTFQSSGQMIGTQRVDVSCDGADCALAPLAGLTVPCTYSVAFTAQRP